MSMDPIAVLIDQETLKSWRERYPEVALAFDHENLKAEVRRYIGVVQSNGPKIDLLVATKRMAKVVSNIPVYD